MIEPGSHIKLDGNITALNSDEQNRNLRKEEVAVEFEEIFARQLVHEMTKDSFKMTGESGLPGSSSQLYREFITDALAGELAAERRLGIANMIMDMWDQTTDQPNDKRNE